MRSRSALVLLVALATVLALPGAALAHGPENAWSGLHTSLADTTITTDLADVDITRQSDNVEFVSHVDVGGPTSDMQFQRREGLQVLKGEVIDRRVDIAVLGGTASPGASIVDITNPEQPEVLSVVTCGGFHSDIAIYENYMIQGWDGSTIPCNPADPVDPDGLDAKGSGDGLRIYDITDPAAPRLVKRYFTNTSAIPAGVHNITVNNEAGLVYLNMAEFNAGNPPWGFVDLDNPELPLTVLSIRDWSPTAGDGCHDSALLPAGIRPDLGEDAVLYACPGITASYIWDITDPRNPVEVAYIPNPSIGIHHGGRFSPDGNVLVLGDELAGAAVGAPEASCSTIGGGPATSTTIGATWFYNVTVPQAPVPVGTFSVTDQNAEYCTSHFYNFHDTEDRNLMIGGWYDAGIEIVDYTAVAGGLPGIPESYAVFEPAESGFFSAYEWHGYVYGSSFEYGAAGKNKNAPGRGMWIIKVDGIEDRGPLAVDEGIVHGRWNQSLDGAQFSVGDLVTVGSAGLIPLPTHTDVPTDALAMGAVGLGAVALLPKKRRRLS